MLMKTAYPFHFTPFCLAVVLLLGNGLFAQTPKASLDSLCEQFRQAHQIPALAVAWVTENNLVLHQSGVLYKGSVQPLTDASMFHLGSNTKAITAWLALKLVETQKINLDTRFLSLFPEMMSTADTAYHHISLQDLLAHKARIQPYTAGLAFLKLPEEARQTRQAFAAFVLQEPPAAPDTYSNAGYALAALMLEKASGMNYEALLAHTFNTLNWRYTWGFPNKLDSQVHPWGHWPADGNPTAPDHLYALLPVVAPAGDLAMPLADYARFIQQNLLGLDDKDDYLSRAHYTYQHYGLSPYSLGWANFLLEHDSRVSFHNGSAGTFFCQTYLYPDEGFGIIIMFNEAASQQIQALENFREALIHALYR